MWKKTLISLGIILGLCELAFGVTYHVSPSGNIANSGAFWGSPIPLQHALSIAVSGDRLFLLAGTYRPTTSTDRNISFVVPAGVLVYGGFVGTETSPTGRTFPLAATILSGNIGLAGSTADNSFCVVRMASSLTTRLDGLIIEGGNQSNNSAGQFGSAIDMSYSGNTAFALGPYIENCTIRNNITASDGVVRMVRTDGISSPFFRPQFTTCTFSGNTRSDNIYDGVNYFYLTIPTFTQCTFSNNSCSTRGGAIHSASGGLILTQCTFNANNGTLGGGAIYLSGDYLQFSASNCTFTSNTGRLGGAIMFQANTTSSSGLALNTSIFTSNSGRLGGAIYLETSTDNLTVTLNTCTINSNAALIDGGAVYWKAGRVNATVNHASLNITYSKLQGNSANGIGGAIKIEVNTPALPPVTALKLYSSFVTGNSADNGGAIYFESGSTVGVNANVGFHALNSTIAGNAASFITPNAVLFFQQAPTTINIDNSIISHHAVSDFGYGGTASQSNVAVDYSLIQDGWTGSGANNYSGDPLFAAAISPASAPTTSGDFHITCASPCLHNGSNALSTSVAFDIDLSSRILRHLVDIGADEYDFTVGGGTTARLYVDASNTAATVKDGLSWATAFTNLWDALLYKCDEVTEIWVANGTYLPSMFGDRALGFQLLQNTALYGGFAGGETALSQRDINANLTVLSGEIGTSWGGDNTYHIISPAANTRIDGFLIMAGSSWGSGASGANLSGAGVLVQGNNVTIENCRFYDNYADENGGAILCGYNNLTLRSCTIDQNNAGRGAGMFLSGIGHVIEDCIFSRNDGWGTAQLGAGVYLSGSTAGDIIFRRCTFTEQYATSGAAVYSTTVANVSMFNCNISGNSANNAPAVYATGPFYAFNTLISGNNTDLSTGGALQLVGSISWLVNSTVAGNNKLGLNSNANISLINSIVYANENNTTGACNLINSMSGGGTDPMFVSNLGWTEAPFTYGDFRLRYCSPAKNAGNSAYMAGLTTDLDGLTRILGSSVDLGCYENRNPTRPNTPIRYYVNQATGNDSNDGLSWGNAKATIQAALKLTCEGDEVWVASGLYRRTYAESQTDCIYLPKGVKLYGSFAGNETSIAQRVIASNPSTLTSQSPGGQFARQGTLRSLNNNATAVIDGFTFTGSISEGFGALDIRGDIITGTGQQNIANCTFNGIISSYGLNIDRGHALTVYAYQRGTGPILSNCTFSNLQTYAGKHTDIENVTSISFTNCNFNTNRSRLSIIQSVVELTNCSFSSQSYVPAIAMSDNYIGTGYNNGYNYTAVKAVGCTFSGNSHGLIEVTANQRNVVVELESMNILNNTSNSPLVQLHSKGGKIISTLINSNVNGNTGTANGAILHLSKTAGFIARNDVSMSRNYMQGNSGTNGGVIYTGAFGASDSLSMNLRGCLFSGNAATRGAVLYYGDGGYNLFNSTNNTFAGNKTTNTSSSVIEYYSRIGSLNNLNFQNSIIYHNNGTFSFTGGAANSHVTVTRSIVEGAWAGPGSFNYSENPLFEAPMAISSAPTTGGNYRLDCASVGLDRGSNSYGTSGRDLDGSSRLANMIIDLGPYELPLTFTSTLPRQYVDASRLGATGQDGSSWANAYENLQMALRSRCGLPTEIWVADGTYFAHPTDPTASFTILNGADIYGGFEGTETSLGQRDIAAHATVLSGNIGNPSVRSDNTHAIAIVNPHASTCVLDGLTFSDANNYTSTIGQYGSALKADAGAVSNMGLVLRNCTFTGNENDLRGGAVYHNNLTTCQFENCTFTNNFGDQGGAIYSGDGTAMLKNCVFQANACGDEGAAIYNNGNFSTFINCLFSGNAGNTITNLNADIFFLHCTLASNEGYVFNNSASSVEINNTIVWGNLNSVFGGGLMDNGGSALQGVTTINPEFISLPAFNTAPHTNGDYRMKPCAALVNTGLAAYASGIPTDLDGLARVNGSNPDPGVYESNLQQYTWFDDNGQTLSANYACPDGTGWVHYYNLDEKKLLLSLFPNGNNLGTLGVNLSVDVSTANTYGLGAVDLSAANYVPMGNTWMTSNRNWNVTTNQSINPAQPVSVRFYYTPTDISDVQNSINAINPGVISGINDLQTFKLDGTNNPFNLAPTAANFHLYNKGNASASLSEWIAGTYGTFNYMEYQVQSFSGGGLGFMASPSVLPIELNRFSAKPINILDALLEWETETELNSSHFILHRSTNLLQWSNIAERQAAGQSNSSINYTHTDLKPGNGTFYYRLQMFDLDGSFEYSNIEAVTFERGTTSALSTWPSPCVNTLHVQLTLPDEDQVKLKVYNMLGIQMLDQAVLLDQANQQIEFDTDGWPAGQYNIVVEGTQETYSTSFIKL